MKKIYITIFAGVCALTVSAQTATTDPGVVINGVKWATRNVDMPGTFAETPESKGMFYQFDRKIGWSTTDPLISSSGDAEWFYYPSPHWEEINNPCPSGWRVPTVEELQSLVDAASTWILHNGVYGRLFGTVPNTVFLPVAGNRHLYEGTLYTGEPYDDGFGAYWSATRINSTSDAYFLHLNSGQASIGSLQQYYGLSVRCVKDDTETNIIENVHTNKLQISVADNLLSFKNLTGLENVQILDISGRTMVNGKLSNGKSINISHLSAGIYIVKAGEKTAKFVKK